ncbi:MAG: sporulation protein YtfJ [Ruminococcaceae bacterium]|nr:sporulation protein YtfJ [Oscillospiraceae bacterium]
MAEHPIHNLMDSAMQNIKEMVDVNTIIGDPVQSTDGTVILPVSKVSFGLAAGGGEYSGKIDITEGYLGSGHLEDAVVAPVKYPFAGGSGAGVSITPVAFITVSSTGVKLIPISSNDALDKFLDLCPDILNKIYTLIKDKAQESN